MEQEIKIEKRRKTFDIIVVTCPHCGVEMEGFSQSQLLHNMTVHMIRCMKLKNKVSKNASES